MNRTAEEDVLDNEALRAAVARSRASGEPTLAQKYRKKPAVVEAIQWTGDNLGDVQAFVGRMENMDGDVSLNRFREPCARDNYDFRIWNSEHARLWVEANTTWLPVEIGDWVIKEPGWTGYYYPCLAEVFDETYELVAD